MLNLFFISSLFRRFACSHLELTLKQTFNQSINQSINQSVGQSDRYLVGRRISQSQEICLPLQDNTTHSLKCLYGKYSFIIYIYIYSTGTGTGCIAADSLQSTPEIKASSPVWAHDQT